MTLLGSSEVAGNALRSSKVLGASFALRHWAARKSRMTATPPKHQLWHPARGISFSPVTRSPNLAPQDAQASNGAAVATNQGHRTAPRQNGVDASSLYPKLEGLSLSTLGEHTPKSNGAALEEAKAADEEAGTTSADKQTTASEKRIPDEPPVATLPFKIVDDLFYAAKKATAGSTGSFWSYTQYRGAAEDGLEQKVKVHYCRSTHTMERVCKEYFLGENVLGFDLEWAADSMKRQGVKRNVSLIQLASPSRIGLFHLALFANKDDMVGPSFRAIMEDENITKVGVAIKGDTTRLRNFLEIDSKGLLELSHLYKLVTYSAEGRHKEINKRLVPLATQVEEYLHLPLFKGQDVRSSDWTKPLNMDQVIYSASDAYAGLQLYATLEHHRKQLDPCPPTPHHAERNLPIRLADGVELATTDDPVVDAAEEKDLEATPAKSRSSSKIRAPKDSRVEIAEDRVTCYRAAHPQARATFVQLRAYYMWHDQGLEPQTIAQLLRDPPLKTSTVVSYILWAIQLERLPVNGERLREEIASTFPDGVLGSRWSVAAAAIAVPASVRANDPTD
ncbi:ribonuclease H-like protein [Hypomontagnella monticulosa]|nr:ribonuclease H-like protein [Hypomontagnella monticulosa]